MASRSPGRRRKGASRCSSPASIAAGSGSACAPCARTNGAIASPAMPPNTVELATPLPPRRFAPCTPPVSSPAAKRPRHRCRAIGAEHHAAHHVVRGRHHLDQAAGEVEAAVGAALDHALEAAPHVVRPEVRHLDVDAAVRRRAALRASRSWIERARRRRAWRARRARRRRHEALAAAVEQVAAGAAQALLEHRAGHARVAGRRAGPSDGTAPSPCRAAAARRAAPWRGRRRSCRPTACGTCTSSARRRWRAARPSPARAANAPVRMSIISTPATRRAVGGRDQLDGAMLLEPPDVARPDLLGEPVDDLDAGEVALVHRAVEGLAGERLLVDRAVGVAVEEAAELVLQLVDALHAPA